MLLSQIAHAQIGGPGKDALKRQRGRPAFGSRHGCRRSQAAQKLHHVGALLLRQGVEPCIKVSWQLDGYSSHSHSLASYIAW